MALTSEMVRNASDHLTEVDKAMFIVMLKQSDLYRQYAISFSGNVVSRVDAAEGTVKARMINAIIKELDKLGVGVVEIRGDKDAVWWNQQKERQALLSTALYVLFDVDVEGAGGDGTGSGIFPDRGVFGDIAVGQRPRYVSGCGHYTRCDSYPHCGCLTRNVYRVAGYGY